MCIYVFLYTLQQHIYLVTYFTCPGSALPSGMCFIVLGVQVDVELYADCN